MVEKESSKNESISAGGNEDLLIVVAKAKAESRAAQARAKAEEKARLKAEKALTETRESRKAAQEKAAQERLSRMEAEKALAEARQALARAQAEIEQARQPEAEAERSLQEARQTSYGVAERAELPLVELEQVGVEQRVSFVVRLTVDEKGQPKRTEVEHAQSGNKESFPAFNLQRLSDFMKACIEARTQPETDLPHAPTPTKVEPIMSEIPKVKSSLAISDVQAFHKGAPGVRALTFKDHEEFEVQVSFQRHGLKSDSLASGVIPFVVKVYANEIAQGTSILLSTYHGNLEKDMREYSVRIQVAGLSPGLYRLLTLVSIFDPDYIVGYFEGSVFQVSLGQAVQTN